LPGDIYNDPLNSGEDAKQKERASSSSKKKQHQKVEKREKGSQIESLTK